VDLYIPGRVAAAGQKTGIVSKASVFVFFKCIEPFADGRHVVKLPDVDVAADGKFPTTHGEPHRLHEVAEMSVEHSGVVPQDDQLARLIGSDQNRKPRLGEDLRQIRSMHAPQRGRGIRGRIGRWCFGHANILNCASRLVTSPNDD
jgi:hypothetical protein